MDKSDFMGFDKEAIDMMKALFIQALKSTPINIQALTVHAEEANIYTDKKQPTLPETKDPLYPTIGKEMEIFFKQIDQFATITNLDDLIDEIVWKRPPDEAFLALQMRLRKKLTLSRRNSVLASYHRGELQLSGMMWLLAQLRRGGIYDCSTSLMAESFMKKKDDLPDFNEQMKFYLQQYSSRNSFRNEEDKLLADWILNICVRYKNPLLYDSQ